MQSIRETTPPLYFHLVTDISKKGLGDNQFLEETLNQVHPLSSVATWISAIMTNENNEIGKRDLFTLLLRSLSSAEDLDDGFTDDLIIQLVTKIAGFPFQYRDESIYDSMKRSLSNLYKKLSPEGIARLQTSIQLTSTYASFVFAVLSIDHATKVPAILGGPQNTIPTFEGIILFLSEKEYEKLDADSQDSINRSNLSQIITQQVSAFSDSSKVYGLRLLLAYFHFQPEEAMRICPPLPGLLGFLKKDLLKNTTIQILSQPPLNEKIKGNETKVAIAISSQALYAGEYTQESTKFIVNNETMSAASDDYIQQLLRVEQYALAGCIVAHEKELFVSQPELVQIAFPNPVKRMRIAIELSKCIQKPTQALYEAMLNQAFVAYATSNETNGIKNFIEIAAVSGYSECFANFLLKRLVEVTNQKVLNALGDEIKASLNNQENAIQRVAPSEPELFYKLICHLYGQCETQQNALNILSIYKDVPTDLLKSEGPIEPFNFISAVISESDYAAFLGVANSCISQHPSVVNLCICLPNLDGSEIHKLISLLQNDNTYTLDIGVPFYTYLANNYQDHFFAYLEKEKIGKQVTNNIFVNRKKKARIDDTVRAVMRVLPKSIENKNQAFDENGQKRLYAIICSILPRVNLQDFTEDIKKLGVLFSRIKDVAPLEEEYSVLVDTGFVEEYHIIFKNVTGHPELAKKLIQNYINSLQDIDSFADKINGTPEEKAAVISNIGETAKSLFALDPSEETLFFTLDALVKKTLHPKRQRFINIKYPIIIQKFAEAARSHNVGVSQPNFVSFITRLIGYANSRNPEVRVAVHIAFEQLFGVDHIESLTDKERTELFENQVSEAAVEEQQQEETPKNKDEEDGEEEDESHPQPQQAPSNKSNQNEQDYHYTNDQIDESVVKLYENCQKNMSVEFVNELLNNIITKKIFTPAIILFIRALFQARENFASHDYSDKILKLYLLQPQMTVPVQFQFDKGVYALAERSLPEFVDILLSSESPYQFVVIKVILRNPTLRELFIDTAFTYLNSSPHIERRLGMSYLLKAIIESEGCDIRPKSFAMLISSIIIWIGALYHENKEDRVNLIKLNNQTNDISKVIDMITLRTCIASVFGMNINVSNLIQFCATQRALAAILVAFPADQLTVLFPYINKIIDSENKPFVLSAGLFAIAMTQGHTFISSHTQELIDTIIPDTVVHSFEKADPLDVTSLCYQADSTFLDHLNNEQIKTIYGILVKNLVEHIGSNESAFILNLLAGKLNGDDLLPDDLCPALRRLFEVVRNDDILFDLLNKYLSVKCDIEDFSMDNDYMNILQIFSKLHLTDKPRPILDILKKISKSDDIIPGIIGKAKVDDTVLAEIGLSLSTIHHDENEEEMNRLRMQIYNALKESTAEEAEHFKQSLFDWLIWAGESKMDQNEQIVNATTLLIA